MRCPYCGGLNQERAAFCVNCGRDLARGAMPARPGAASQAPYQPARPGTAPQGRPVNAPPVYRAPNQQQQQPGYPPVPPRPTSQPAQPQQAQTAAQVGRRQPAPGRPTQAPAPVVVPPPAPEPPVPFPPRTVDQFNALLPSGAQQYTVVESSLGDGKRKLVRIAYTRCVGWQQAATLLKALK
ncbi:MAG TPA: hypothetical protein VH164_04025, partial [Ktedonobacteraceae bacterium]|nr:hypothetical protein [Ktedonobacteraceae bacterium]